MKVSFSNPNGTYIRIEHDDGTWETVHITEQGSPVVAKVLGMVAKGELRIKPFKPPQEAKKK
jgi:hypothetical protein